MPELWCHLSSWEGCAIHAAGGKSGGILQNTEKKPTKLAKVPRKATGDTLQKTIIKKDRVGAGLDLLKKQDWRGKKKNNKKKTGGPRNEENRFLFRLSFVEGYLQSGKDFCLISTT